ncbi:MAG: phytoene desaturase family protein [Myxococcota bacterium]
MKYDVVVIGAGPNGLAAAIACAREGLGTLVVEAKDAPGGGVRTQELTQPGFWSDVCSTVHPLAVASPYFREIELEEQGIEWVHSPAAVVHLLSDDIAVSMERSVALTAEQFGPDRNAYIDLMQPFSDCFDELCRTVLGPLRIPSSPRLLARFGLSALQPLSTLCAARFQAAGAPALLAGIAAHAMLPLDALATTSFGLVLGCAGHAVGWPIARGGSQTITDALVRVLALYGGEIRVNRRVQSMRDLPDAHAYLFDVTPKQLLAIAGSELSASYRHRLSRFRYGPGVFKMDWALSAPIPWKNAACARAATVHLAGSLQRVSDAEARAHRGSVADPPFLLLVQPSLFDPSRVPPGKHTAWAYCHVPNGFRGDLSHTIEQHIEHFAPGFRDLILARSARGPREIELYNENYVGGDINAGLADITQLLWRPVLRADPYRTSADNLFLCSSSTPPGGGVHGLCGYWAARSVLKQRFAREMKD